MLRVGPERIEPTSASRPWAWTRSAPAELIAAVNARFGTGIVADALFDHPTPASPRPARPGGDRRPAGPRPRPERTEAEADIREALRRRLAGIPGCDPRDRPGTPFHLLGLDSILAAEFVAAIDAAHELPSGGTSLSAPRPRVDGGPHRLRRGNAGLPGPPAGPEAPRHAR